MSDYSVHQPVIIAASAALSGAVRLDGSLLCGLIMPADWTAASLTFQGSQDNVTFNDLYDDSGTEKTVTAAADRHIILDPAEFAGIKWIKVRSGTSGTPVNQAAARTIYLVARPA